MSKTVSVRALAARAITKVAQGESLNTALPLLQDKLEAKVQPLLAELCYGTLRFYHRLDAWTKGLLEKPLKEKDQDIHHLILVGLYQLNYMRTPAHAAIAETVDAVNALKKSWAKGLVNGVLRNAQRNYTELSKMESRSPVCHWSHPKWLVNNIKRAWPEQHEAILVANNRAAPMTLRVNVQHATADVYLQHLRANGIEGELSTIAPQAITLHKPVSVDKLPHFAEGYVSVQDESAQLAGNLLSPYIQAGDRVLDACCAPGGKTCHLLELHSNIRMDALDCDTKRLERVTENLQRLQLSANVLCGDASDATAWFSGVLYDHMLLDAPCSATGVIRRHPDIKLLRTAQDIEALAALQSKILRTMWSLLKPNGTLLYATCSIMPQENHLQIQQFITETPNATIIPITAPWGLDTGFGKQLFPNSSDGFFYSLIKKTGK